MRKRMITCEGNSPSVQTTIFSPHEYFLIIYISVLKCMAVSRIIWQYVQLTIIINKMTD